MNLPILFWLIRNPLTRKLLGVRPKLWLIDHSSGRWQLTFAYLRCELATSKDPRYSSTLLDFLAGLPSEGLEDKELQDHFAQASLGVETVKEAVDRCRAVLSVCFLP